MLAFQIPSWGKGNFHRTLYGGMDEWVGRWVGGCVLSIKLFLTEASDVLWIKAVPMNISQSKRDPCEQKLPAIDSSQILLSVSHCHLHISRGLV